MLRLLTAFLLGLLILGIGNAAGLTAWVRDRKPAVVADFLLPFAEAWQKEIERLGGGGYLAWLRSCRISLLES